MNREIIELRQVVTKLVPLLAGKGLTVTQRGTGAYVRANPKTNKPEVVNIPNIPDNAEPDFIRAIQGFIDHEVAHVLITDFDVGFAALRPAEKMKLENQRLHNFHNIVEDTMIEREMAKRFPGSRKNISDLRKHFIEKVSAPAIRDAKDEDERFAYLLVVMMRALAGHVEFKQFMDENKYWDHPMVAKLMKAMKPSTIRNLPKLTTTKQTFEVAKEIDAILYPPAPPPVIETIDPNVGIPAGGGTVVISGKHLIRVDRVMFGKKKSPRVLSLSATECVAVVPEGEEGSVDVTVVTATGSGKLADGYTYQVQQQQQQSQDEDQDESDESEGGEGKPDDNDGQSQDKPEKEAGEGDGDGERDHSESEDEGEEGESEEEGSAGDGDEDEENSSEDQNTSSGDADEESEDAGDDDGDDEESASGDDESGEADEEDGDDEGSTSGDEDAVDEDGDSGEDESENGDEGDDADGDASGDDTGEDEGDDAADAGTTGGNEGDDSDTDGQDGDSKIKGVAINNDDHDAVEIGDNASGEGAGVGNGLSDSPFNLPDDAFKDKDLSSAIAVIVTNMAVDAMQDSEYNVYTREFDRIEPMTVPDGMPDDIVPKLEDEVRSMTGRMQKDIERMMASQSHVVKIPGFRSGRLHGPSLHRIISQDDRVFNRRQEHKSKDTAVMLLIDNSASMSGSKCRIAMVGAYALATTLERVGIASEVMGFTTGGYDNVSKAEHKRMNQEMSEAYNKGIVYHRTTPIAMPIYKDFDERINSTVKQRIAYMARYQNGMSVNVDGESLQYAAIRLMARKEKRKVMLVLSDGQPSGARNAAWHLKRTVEDLSKTGIELVGIGIQDDSVQRFYENWMVLENVEDLPALIMGELKRILTT